MEFLERDSQIKAWRALLPRSEGAARFKLMRSLAWHLRQRDTRHALQLVDEIEHAPEWQTLSAQDRIQLGARLSLVRAEASWLFADLPQAEQLGSAALTCFDGLRDFHGIADAHWLLAWVASDSGDSAGRDAHLHAAANAAQQGDDPLRQRIALAGIARASVFTDLHAAIETWGDALMGEEALIHPGLATWALDFRYLVASKSQDIGRAVGFAIRMFEAARDTGQIHRAITAASNIGFDLTRINDHQSALEWMQRGLDLARTTGWPSSTGMCLTETAETLRQLKQLDAARDLLHEALQIMSTLANCRWMALALNYLGDVELDSERYDAALTTFQQLQARAKSLQQADLLCIAERGLAHALSCIGQPDAAMACAENALALARSQSDRYNEVAALRVMADIQSRHRNATATLPDQPSVLDLLHQALEVAGKIDGFIVPGDLLETLAKEHAHQGDDFSAYRIALQAIAAHERIHTQRATDLAVSMQIRHETDRIRELAEHHRHLAEAETARASSLQQVNLTLEQLGRVGQQITAQLDVSDILQTLRTHVEALLDASSFIIYLVDDDGESMQSALFIEQGIVMPADRIARDDPLRHAARCWRDRHELVLGRPPGLNDPSQIPDTLTTLSALFTPLLAGDRVLGVMSVQSLTENAYGDLQQRVFRTLCAYGAIALDNARAYRKLAQTQASLRDSQRDYQRVVSNISDALMIIDAEGRVTYANDRFLTLFALNREHLDDFDMLQRVAPEYRERVALSHSREVLGQREGSKLEFEVVRVDESRIWIDARLTRITAADGSFDGIQATLRDITEHKRAEVDMQTNLARERELGQLKSRFVSMTSHEFRTPLAGILSSVELLRHYGPRLPDEEKAELFGQIECSVDRMTTMLDNILLIGRADAKGLKFNPAPMDLAALCRELAEEATRSRPGGNGRPLLVRDYAGVEGEWLLDATLLRHILSNLLSNAFKYSPGGGEVVFRTRISEGRVQFEVADQGIGIPLADQARLFESFHRASNVGTISGTGLGLTIVKQSVELHGGTIAIDSAPGRGTRFLIDLPIG